MLRKSKKISVLFFALFLPFLFFKGSYAEEIEEEPASLEIIIHRLITEAHTPIIDNGGKEIDTASLTHLKGLNGVTFSIYEITDQLEARLKQGDTLEQAHLNLIQASYTVNNLVPLQTSVTANLANEDGIASFNLPIFLSKRQAFLIYENSSPTEVTMKSDQLVLITPVYSQLGERMDTVHLYPKNISKSAAPTPPPKTVDTAKKQLPTTAVVEEISNNNIFKSLPSTGELVQSAPFLLGIIIVIGGVISYSWLNKKQHS